MGLSDRRAHAFKCCSCVRLCGGGKIVAIFVRRRCSTSRKDLQQVLREQYTNNRNDVPRLS